MLNAIVTKFKNFRDQIFSCFTFRADTTMDLIDALSGNQDASSVVQLSLNPAFKREYGSVRDAIANFSGPRSTCSNRTLSNQTLLTYYCNTTLSLISYSERYRAVKSDRYTT